VVEQKTHPEKTETDQEVSVVQQIQPRAIADNMTAQIKVHYFELSLIIISSCDNYPL
jgi:hypothetical protein